MTLTPISKRLSSPAKTEEGRFTPIFKSDDPDFNHEYAAKIYKAVMMLDDDTAEEFVNVVVSDVLETYIEKNLRTLQGHLDKVVAKRLDLVKKSMIRKAAGNPDAVPYAQALSRIEKANQYDYGFKFKESDFRRDAGGRFSTKISHTQQKPIKGRTAGAMGIPKHSKLGQMDRRQEAEFQDEYRQLANFLGSVNQSSRNPGDSNVLLHIKQRGGDGQVYHVDNGGTRPDGEKWDPTREQLVGVTARPSTLSLGGAAFGLTQSLGQPGVRALNELDSGSNDFARSWVNDADGDDVNSNARTYRRVEAGSKLVGSMAPPGSKVQMAARMGEFAGSFGPEAEAVFGPSTRKAAYRYRGTERKPDDALVQQYGVAVRGAQKQADPDQRLKIRTAQNRAIANVTNERARQTGQPAESIRLSNQERTEIMNRAAQRVTRQVGDDTPSWEQRDGGRAIVNRYLESKLPNQRNYELQLKSGNTPPSEGVLLNSKGQIAHQAVGYGDDHYLPFNLRNMKALKGGEYIRSRSVGGPTSEDIYTGLVSGARQVQVVSRSGTFTVKFKDDFRGGRRHNDKAKRMTRRYEQLLDAIQSRDVSRQSLAPDVKTAIEQQVMRSYPGQDKEMLRDQIAARTREFSANEELTDRDEELIRTLASVKSSSDNNSRDSNIYVQQATNDILTAKRLQHRLDGPGYAAALKALEEQFPYYIEVPDPVLRNDRDVQGIEDDRGYVRPGRNRPRDASAGLYGNEGRAGKFSAEEADYQGARVRGRSTPYNPANRTQGQPTTGGETREAAPASTKVDESITRVQRSSAAPGLKNALNDEFDIEGLEDERLAPLMMDDDELEEFVRTPQGAKDFDAAVALLESDIDSDTPQSRAAINAYKRSAGQVGPVEYDDSKGLMDGEYEFSAVVGTRANDGITDQARVLTQLANVSSIKDGTPITRMDEPQLQQEIRDVSNYLQVAKDNPDAFKGASAADNREKARRAFLGSYDNVNLSEEALTNHLAQVQRMRTMLRNAPDAVTAHRETNPRTSEGRDLFNAEAGRSILQGRVEERVEAWRGRLKNMGGSGSPQMREFLENEIARGESMVDDIKAGEIEESEVDTFLNERR